MGDAICGRGWAYRCAHAKGPRCTCRCGGENHGHPAARGGSDRSELTPRKVFERQEGVDYSHFLALAAEVKDIHLTRTPGAEHQVGSALVDIPQRFVVHSPTGFEWGYGGSGPADLALNILGLFVPPPEAWRLHQDFKWRFIAGMPKEGGTIRGADVVSWIRQQWVLE